MVTETMLQQYQDKGYMIFENLFRAEEMDRIRSIIDRFDEETERRLQEAGQQFINIPRKISFSSGLNFLDPALQKFTADQRFVNIATSVLGPDVRLYWDQSVYKRPEADRDFPWHQDNGYVPTDPVHYLTCWLALEDSTIENGCIWIQPESHKNGYVEHVKTDIGWQCYFGDDPGMPVELKKGSMVAFHSLLYHRSSPNLTKDVTRKAYIIQYSVEGARNPVTGKVFKNGPLIAQNGSLAYTGFIPREEV